MSRQLSPLSLASTISVLALGACDESPIPTGPRERPSLAAATAVSYSVKDLEILDAGEGGAATGINTNGQVAGYILRVDDLLRGFVWSNGVTTFLGTLGGRHTIARDINDNGQVVGSSENANRRMRAFRWANGTMRNLGTLGGNVSEAAAINSLGHAVGKSQLTGNLRDPQGNPIVHAFLWKNGVMTDLGTLGGLSSAALDINDKGQVVGWSQTSNGTRHPFLWQNGVMKDLLQPGSGNTGTAYGISPVGVVVGERNNHAFRYSGGSITPLALGTTAPSVATGIRSGRIVGYLDNPGARRGFVLSASGQVTVLPLLPGSQIEGDEAWAEAWAINDAGVIVGRTIRLFDSYVKTTMWTPQ